MKFDRTDIAALGVPITVCAISAILGLAVWFASSSYSNRVREASNRSDRELDTTRSQLHRARLAEENFRSFASTYQALETRGLVGEERRLDWVERIQAVAARHQLYSLQYDIAPRRPLQLPGLASAEAGAFASAVHIDATGLHEDALVDFLEDLHQDTFGVFVARKCSLERLGEPSTTVAAHVRADCQLDWVTLQDKAS